MSAKAVADKLLIKPGTTVWSSEPARLELVGPLPDGVRPVDALGEADAALVFADDAVSLRAILGAHAGELAEPRAFWVAYPKGNRSDLNRDRLWPILAEHGMRPISQVAVDEVWSALRFRALEEGEPPFTGGAG
jgi:hypothetical protein